MSPATRLGVLDVGSNTVNLVVAEWLVRRSEAAQPMKAVRSVR